MSPNLGARGHIDFVVDPIGVCVGTFLAAQYHVNQWLDSYQIFMHI